MLNFNIFFKESRVVDFLFLVVLHLIVFLGFDPKLTPITRQLALKAIKDRKQSLRLLSILRGEKVRFN